MEEATNGPDLKDLDTPGSKSKKEKKLESEALVRKEEMPNQIWIFRSQHNIDTAVYWCFYLRNDSRIVLLFWNGILHQTNNRAKTITDNT